MSIPESHPDRTSPPVPKNDEELALQEEHGSSFQMRDFGRPGAKISRILRDLELDEEAEHNEDEGLLVGRTRARHNSVQSFMLYTPDEGKAVRRKLDRRVVGLLFFLYLLSFLDRSNIGNAKIAGLERDLNLGEGQYEWLLTAFYVSYIAFEWMTLLYRIIPAHIYISLCVFSWGILASLQSVSVSFPSLLVLRFLLGVSEAAFGPGVPYYLSFFYRRDELAFRTGLFVSAAPLATSFASSLAWVITRFAEGGPIAPWRLLFLVEGFPSVVVAVVAWECVPDSPDKAKFLDLREREVATLRLRKEKEDADEKVAELEIKYAGSSSRGKLNWREIGGALMDPKSYMTAFMFFSANVAFSSMPVFLPTIIREMGHTSLASQALSAPPYLLSFVAVLLTAHLSDKHRLRSPYIFLHSLLASAGYLLIALAGHLHWSPILRYIGVYPACIGFFSVITLIITWTLNNQQGESAKGAGMVMLGFIGQCGPLLGTRLYPEAEGPEYVKGMSVCAVFMAGVGVLAVSLALLLKRKNTQALGRWTRSGGQESGKRRPFLSIL